MTESGEKVFAAEKQFTVRQYFIARNIFLRLLGIIYFFAFLAILFQAKGLLGQDGVLPYKEYLQAVDHHYGAQRFWTNPTIFWLNSSDGALSFFALLGLIFSVVLMSGLIPALACLVLWFLYLSFIYIGQDFLGFQWDILLAEVGFLSIFLSPWRIKISSTKEQFPQLVLLLLQVVLFKLMLQSGLAKLLSEDKTWSSFNAMTFHYWTQPIPNPISWYIHQLPVWFHQLSCFLMFIIELFVPCWIFMGRIWRLGAIGPLIGLQLLIILTGNYGFFNFLTIVLCVLLIDDEAFRAVLPNRLFDRLHPKNVSKFERGLRHKTKVAMVYLMTIFICLLTVHHFSRITAKKSLLPGPLKRVALAAQTFVISNSYGLFAVMTTKRPEIVIEGSTDGRNWIEYRFRYKPGDVDRRPPFVAPYHPRLDWQMWFAALSGDVNRTPWMFNLFRHLFDNTPTVMSLMDENPFKDRPPVFLRANLYLYEFTSPAEREETGSWWKRRYYRSYVPMLVNRDVRKKN